MSQSYLRRIYWQLTGVVMLAVVFALAANSYFSHRAFEHALVPEMAKKAETVGASVRALMLKAVEQRMDFAQLYGVEQTFAEVAAENPDFSYYAATDTHGAILFQRGEAPVGAEAYFRNPEVLAALSRPEPPPGAAPTAVRVGSQYIVSLPVIATNGPVGVLHVGLGVRFVDNIVLDLLFDVLVILVVALFFTLELLHFMAGGRLEAGLRSLAQILERGRVGNFTMPPKEDSDREYGKVVKLLEAAIARVNAGFLTLTREVEAAKRDPAHERKTGLSAARGGLEELRRRYRFGTEPAAEGPNEGLLARMRAPLFTFILAEELTRSFLPSYVDELLVPIAGISPQIVLALPIALFMLIVAVAQPYLGAYCERVGQRKAMLSGAAIAATGFFASALAHSVLDLLVWRSLCAVGYAMVFVAAQGFVLNNTNAASRARGFAMFIGAIMVATVCGPSIGGILADNIGERLTFGLSAVLALASIFAIRMLPQEPRRPADHPSLSAPRMSDIASLLLNGRFMKLTGLAAMPAKILLTGVCFYLVPLYILSIGSTQAMAGRILMTYAVVMVLMSPIAATLANTREQREWLVVAGLCVSGIGGLLMLASSSVFWVFAAVLLIGLGQSLSITAQSALVSEHCHEEIARMGDHTVYGVYRLLERCGNALGPLIAGALVMAYGYQHSFVAIGALVLFCGVLFALATRVARDVAPATAG